jgi:predicted CXXCH cytochrome family protein
LDYEDVLMKKLITVCLLLASGNAFAAIDGSAHDFVGDASWGAGNSGGATEICAYCHTPHSANTNAKPLWNKSTLTTTSYTAYGTTIAGTAISNGGTQSGATQLCLGCHDGSVAPGTVANPPNVTGWTDNATVMTSSNSAFQDNNFANDHPVGFDFSANPAAAGIQYADVSAAELAGYPMEGNNMTCATCHNVHAATGVETLLVTTNENSAMCQDCHGK